MSLSGDAGGQKPGIGTRSPPPLLNFALSEKRGTGIGPERALFQTLDTPPCARGETPTGKLYLRRNKTTPRSRDCLRVKNRCAPSSVQMRHGVRLKAH